MTTGGKLLSCGAVLVECRCLNPVMVATGSSWSILTSSAPGSEPREVAPTQGTLEPAPEIFCLAATRAGSASAGRAEAVLRMQIAPIATAALRTDLRLDMMSTSGLYVPSRSTGANREVKTIRVTQLDSRRSSRAPGCYF